MLFVSSVVKPTPEQPEEEGLSAEAIAETDPHARWKPKVRSSEDQGALSLVDTRPT